MRLLLFALALLLAGCGAFDCPSIGPYQTAELVQFLRAEPAASDTLYVVVRDNPAQFAYVRDVFVAVGAETPEVSETSETEVRVEVEFSNYEAERSSVPRLDVEARGDTVWVQLPDLFLASAPACARSEGVVQPVCSYADPVVALYFYGVSAPASVRHVEYLRRDSYGYLVPLPEAASAHQAVAPRQRRTARG